MTPRDGAAGQAGPVVVITDSAASLPGELTARYAIRVVPLRLLAGGVAADDDGSATTSAQLASGGRASTSGPAPDRFVAAYQEASAKGARAAVCVLMARELSGTVRSAELASARAALPVRVVDSRSIGMGTGLVALAAAAAARSSAGAAEVAAAAEQRAGLATTFVALASADAALGSGRLRVPVSAAAALRWRPLLQVREGRVEVIERVRTAGAATTRLAELGAGFCQRRVADVGILHTANRERAAELAGLIREAVPGVVIHLAEASAAIAVHAGPGMLAVSLAPHEALAARP